MTADRARAANPRGLTIAQNPTLFTDEVEAQVEAFRHSTTMRAKRAIERQLSARISGWLAGAS